jgi:hypothetical protein
MAFANYGSASDLDKVDFRQPVATQDYRGYGAMIQPTLLARR